jgi:hypothetical protein
MFSNWVFTGRGGRASTMARMYGVRKRFSSVKYVKTSGSRLP